LTEQPGILPDLAALVRAVLFGDRTATAYAERVASHLGIGEDDAPETAEAELRKALGPVLDRKQLGTVLPPGGGSLTAGTATCTGDADDEEEGVHDCGKLSRYVVARSDGDKSFGAGGGTEEACEEHLADAVSGMVDGDENVRAVVTIRWTEYVAATAAGEGQA
jgi:hypothetical protein